MIISITLELLSHSLNMSILSIRTITSQPKLQKIWSILLSLVHCLLVENDPVDAQTSGSKDFPCQIVIT
jgi:hypothetical protein